MAINSQNTLSHSLLNIILVLVESALTFVLRFDGRLRQLAYPLAKNETVVCIRTYLPHTEIYATFSYKGVLLDDKNLSGKAPNLTINAYSYQLFNVLFSHNSSAVDALQIRGTPEDVAMLKEFLMMVGLGGVIDNLLSKVRKKPVNPEQKALEKETKITKLKEELTQKTKENESLQTQVRKLSTELAELKSKQKTQKITLIIACIIALLMSILYFAK